jgi:hypothetical protein
VGTPQRLRHAPAHLLGAEPKDRLGSAIRVEHLSSGRAHYYAAREGAIEGIEPGLKGRETERERWGARR